ncbi:MAG TPA: tetratricopeptide repeat protein [Vicinamibacterales bacterium]
MHVLIVGGSRRERRQAARDLLSADRTVVALDAPTLPFVRPSDLSLPESTPRTFLLDEIDRAFPDAQSPETRLVLTQSTYLLQAWIDAIDGSDRIIATADRAALERVAPEAFKGRGPWGTFEIQKLGNSPDDIDTNDPHGAVENTAAALLAAAYTSTDSEVRLRLCREAIVLAPLSAVAWLSLASARREHRDGDGAMAALDRAAELAPDWAAVPYERGKLRLVFDDMAGARDSFARAGQMMPRFAAAFSNLGATLGELGDAEGAAAAFEQALAGDPRSFTIWNNVGIVRRELGQADESEAALRRAIELEPSFVFGYYNLGHTLFLAGRYQESLDAYEDGRRRDPHQNIRQGCRLALARFATGDADAAEHELWRLANSAPGDERADLLLEAYEVVHALIAADPALAVHRGILDRVGAEITKSE